MVSRFGMKTKFLYFLSILSPILCAETTCPPDGFDSVGSFDIQKYIAKSWYVQQQMPLVYQRESSLFCVVATYDLINSSNPGDGLLVFNYANRREVNGRVVGTGSGGGSTRLQARIPDLNVPSKLLVGIRAIDFLGSFADAFYGDYWVVAVGPVKDPSIGYDWAIVSGGIPMLAAKDGCRTGHKYFHRIQYNDIGLWLFSRKPYDPVGTLQMRRVAKSLGFDLGVLLSVTQEGCRYEGAYIK